MFIHKSSYVDKSVVIGKGSKIWHFCNIMEGSKIGENCIIGQNVFIGHNVVVGNGCKIQNNVSLYTGIVLKDDVFIGPSVVFTNVKNPRAFIDRKDKFLSTLIEKGATIGANATILCGITIGEYSVIAAGSVVTRNVEAKTLVMGNPARYVKTIDKEFNLEN